MIAHTRRPELGAGHRLHERDQVHRATDVDPALELVRREAEPHEGGVSAVGSAHDRHAVLVGDLLLDGPRDGVGKVVLHLAAPLAVAGVDELLAEAGGAAVVDAEHRIATVGQPLVDGIKAPRVAPPGTAVDPDDRGQRIARPTATAGIAVRRQRVVGHERLAVAGLDGLGVHPCEGETLEIRPVGEHQVGRLGRAVVPVVLHRAVVQLEGDDPVLVVRGPAENRDLSVGDGLEVLEVTLDLLVDDVPLTPQIRRGRGLDVALGRVNQHAPAHVGVAVLDERLGRAGGEVDGLERGRVATAAVDHENLVAGLVEAHDAAVQHVLGGNRRERSPLGLLVHHQQLLTAVGQLAGDQTNAVIVVRPHRGEAFVALELHALARLDVDHVEIVPVTIADVQPDHDVAGVAVADVLDARAHGVLAAGLGGRRRAQRGPQSGGGIHAHELRVAVTVRILQIENVLVRVGPLVHADAVVAILGHGAGQVGIAQRRDPDVQHTVERRQEAERHPVRADARVGPGRVGEQHIARNERDLVLGEGRSRHPCHQRHSGDCHLGAILHLQYLQSGQQSPDTGARRWPRRSRGRPAVFSTPIGPTSPSH